MDKIRLLEAAARAAGLPWDQWVTDGDDSWKPLEDDGDALRLAVALDIRMTPGAADSPYAVAEWWVRPSLTALACERVLVEGDRAAALRRATLLAAAAIGAAPVLGLHNVRAKGPPEAVPLERGVVLHPSEARNCRNANG